jgi:membrane-associated phospholipid phosphatase
MNIHAGDRRLQRRVATGPSERSVVRPLVQTMVVTYAALVAVMMAVGLLVTAAFERASLSFDESVERWIVDNRTSLADGLSGVASELGHTTVIVIGLVGFCVAALSARWWQPAFVVAAGLTTELAVFLTVNYWLDRPRPDIPVIGSVPSTASFPSGHAAAAVVFYLGLAMTVTSQIDRTAVRRTVWAVATIIAFSVGVARAYRGVHHPSDVLAGWLVGIVCLTGAVYAIRRTATR